MPTHTALSFISSTSNDNPRSGWKPKRPLSNKPHKEDSNASGTSRRISSACGGRSIETPMASGTAASGELKKLSRMSLRTKGLYATL